MPRRLAAAVALLLAAGCGGGGVGGGNVGATHSVSGVITPAVSGEGARVTVGGRTAVADASGAWRVDGLPAGSYTATPVRAGTTFTPAVRPVVVGTADVGSVNFAATGHFTLSGSIRAGGAQQVDRDTFDRNAAGQHNDTLDTAQPLPSAVTVGGWAGTRTRSPLLPTVDPATVNDPLDYYRVTLAAGQALTLAVSDHDPAAPTAIDLDLCVAAVTGDAPVTIGVSICSVDGGATEALQIDVPGTYIVEVSVAAGASNYVLTIGTPPAAAAAPTLRSDREFVPGEVLVRFKESALSPASAGETLQARAAALGLAALDGGLRGMPALLGLPAGAEARAAALARLGAVPAPLGGLAARGVTPDGLHEARLDTLRAVKALRARADVESADPNYVFHPAMVPTDPYYKLQWHYPLISLPQAWDVTRGSTAAGGVVVAVVDTGVFLAHPDLAGQLVTGYDFISDPARANDGGGRDPNPDDPGDAAAAGASSWHGTHVAGTVAAAMDGAGLVGVAPEARIMPIRALGVGGGTSNDIMQGLLYAAGLANASGRLPTRKADVINLSIGCLGCSSATEQAVYDQVRAAGVIVVAAAGNENSTTPSYPASYSGVISVAAVDMAMARAPYSNRGPLVDLAAPGGDTSKDADGNGYADGVLSTLVNDSTGTRQAAWTFYQGTSMASPHVAGVVALMRAVWACAAPEFTPDILDGLISSGAITRNTTPGSRDDSFGYGLIDALKAVQTAQQACNVTQTGALGVSPGRLDLAAPAGSTTLHATVDVAWSGSGLQNVASATTDAAWLAVQELAVDQTTRYGSYTVSANLTGLAAGTYAGAVTFTPDGGASAVRVPVSLQVGAGAGASDVGYIYLLLIDPVPPQGGSTMTTLAWREGSSSAGVYGFSFTDVTDGQYLLVAGTDSDEDLLICDAGEACGAWPTLGVATPVQVSGGNVTGLDFLVGFGGTIGAASAQPAAPATGWRRLPPVRGVPVPR